MIDLQTLIFAFLEGLRLIVSPSILPVLPIVFTVGMLDGRKKPLGVVIGFIITFIFFSLFSYQLVEWIGIESDMLRQAAYVFLVIFGIVLCSTKLSAELSEFTQHNTGASNKVRVLRSASGFFSGILLGVAIGLVWVPSIGLTSLSFLRLLGLSMGMSIIIFIIAFGVKQTLSKLTFIKYHIHKIRKFLGFVIIVTVFTSSGWLNAIKNITFLPKPATAINLKKDTQLINGIAAYPAPEIMDIDVWINSEALSLKSLKDKVILLNFWAYSCLNCVHTISHLNELYQKYHELGLEIIGVHSPEFAFEKKLMNVSQAIESNNITYPIALDNQLSTWKNYQNKSWPACYLIDKNGNVVYAHVGGGEYDIIENNIRHLLGLNVDSLPSKQKKIEKHSFKVTPKTYLGYEQMEKFQSLESAHLDKDELYNYPPYMRLHHWALKGKWHFGKESITAKSEGARLIIRFFAQKIFVIMGAETDVPINATFKLNGQLLDKNAGKAVKKSELLVNKQTLYEIIALSQYERGELEIISQAPGLQVYAFAFD